MKVLLSLTALTLIAFAVIAVASNAEDAPKPQPEFAGQVLTVSTSARSTAIENVRFVEIQGRMMLVGDEITTVESDYGKDIFFPTGVTVTIAWDKVVQYTTSPTSYKERFASKRDYLRRYDPKSLERLDRLTELSNNAQTSP